MSKPPPVFIIKTKSGIWVSILITRWMRASLRHERYVHMKHGMVTTFCWVNLYTAFYGAIFC